MVIVKQFTKAAPLCFRFKAANLLDFALDHTYIEFCRSLDAFTLLQALGEGQKSSVFKCCCVSSGLLIALKSYHKERMTVQDCKQARAPLLSTSQDLEYRRALYHHSRDYLAQFIRVCICNYGKSCVEVRGFPNCPLTQPLTSLTQDNHGKG